MRPEEFYANVLQNAGPLDQAAASKVSTWESFPFESSQLRVVPLRRPVVPEVERAGEGGRDCPGCAQDRAVIWSDDHWRLSIAEPSGAPLALVLEPLLHLDLTDLTEEWASEFGVLTMRVTQAMESLANIARTHVSRWGDASAHLHVFFYARPAGFSQLHGRCFAIWERFLPPVPPASCNRDSVEVAEILARTHGELVRPDPTQVKPYCYVFTISPPRRCACVATASKPNKFVLPSDRLPHRGTYVSKLLGQDELKAQEETAQAERVGTGSG
jgi:hypothetical protein